MATMLDVAGGGCLVAAAWLVAMPLGLATAGVLLLAASWKATA